MLRRHTLVLAVGFILTASPAFTLTPQDLKLVVDQVRNLCLAGRQFDLSVTGDGGITFRSLRPGANIEVHFSESEALGATQYFDQEVRERVDSRILDCIENQFPAILQSVTQSSDTPNVDPPTPSLTVLYEAGEEMGGFAAWLLTAGWHQLDNILVNDGAGESLHQALAPYTPESRDYVVEAEIRSIREAPNFSSFGVLVRAGEEMGYAVGLGTTDRGASGICYIHRIWDPSDGRDCAVGGPTFEVGNDWHAFRVEARGNRIILFIDGSVIVDGSDNKFLSAGRVGLWSVGYQLEVRSFRVLRL